MTHHNGPASCTYQQPDTAYTLDQCSFSIEASMQQSVLMIKPTQLCTCFQQILTIPVLLSIAGGVAWAVNARQAEALIRAQESLEAVTNSVRNGLPIDFWTIDLRSAVSALGEVSGDDVTEEVLDSVFSQFCIGK